MALFDFELNAQLLTKMYHHHIEMCLVLVLRLLY